MKGRVRNDPAFFLLFAMFLLTLNEVNGNISIKEKYCKKRTEYRTFSHLPEPIWSADREFTNPTWSATWSAMEESHENPLLISVFRPPWYVSKTVNGGSIPSSPAKKWKVAESLIK